MNEATSDLISDLNACLEDCEVYNFIARDSDLQRKACNKLTDLLGRLASLKQKAVFSQNEDMANLLLGFECTAEFLRSEISMWLLLKADEPEEAWRSLVNAQRAVADAVRAHSGFAHLEQHGQRLHAIERLVFPPQVFTSLGMIVRSRRCSICDKEYGECSHLVGKPYNGKICHTIVTEIDEVDHIAIVDKPANKLCRVTHFSVPGGRRNRMTWKVEVDPSCLEAENSERETKATAIIDTLDEISG